MKNRFRTFKSNRRGDTIVEVLIVLAILSMAFSISYATVSGGLIKSQTSEEHSEALGILNSQVELLRVAVSSNVSLASVNTPGDDSFCLVNPSGPNAPVTVNTFTTGPISATPPQPTPDVDFPNYVAAGCVQGNYHYAITNRAATPSGSNYYDLTVRWDGLQTIGFQQEEITYRIPSLANSLGTGYFDPISGSCPCP